MLRNIHGVTSLACLCVLVGVVSSIDGLGSLVQINVVFRHGTRTPFSAPYPTSFWPLSTRLMQLTPTGMTEAYNIGIKIKNRYKMGNSYNLLLSKYDSTHIMVNSSMYSRTIESASTFLAGMYPPEGDQIWNQNLAWQPIPVYARDPWDEPVCNIQTDDTCPKLKTLHAKEREKYVDQINRENKEFFKYLDDKTGNEPGTTDIDYIYFLHDSLVMERNEHKLPDWANEVTPNNLTVMERISQLAAIVFRGKHIQGDLKMILGGKLLENVTRNMKNVNGTNIRAFIYAVHEENLGAALSCLGLLFDDSGDLFQYINPASIAVFELYNNFGQYSVKVAYKDGLAEFFKYLNIPGCGKNYSCPLESFERVGRHCFMTDWRVECGITTPSAKTRSTSARSAAMMAGIVGSVVLLCIVLSAFIIFVVMFRKKIPHGITDDKYQSLS